MAILRAPATAGRNGTIRGPNRPTSSPSSPAIWSTIPTPSPPCPGKDVELNIWVRPRGPGSHAPCGMEALNRNQCQWDEKEYGREYDLDIFNIVAVDDFNMGAMENKGLNVFNSSCVLASARNNATDAEFRTN